MSPYVGRRATYETRRRVREFCDALSLNDRIKVAADGYLASTIDRFGRVDYNAYALALIFYALRESGSQIRMDDFRKACDASKKTIPFRNIARRVTYPKDLRRWYARVVSILGPQPYNTDQKLESELTRLFDHVEADVQAQKLTRTICAKYAQNNRIANLPALVGGGLALAFKKRGIKHSIKQISVETHQDYAKLTYYYRHLMRDQAGLQKGESGDNLVSPD